MEIDLSNPTTASNNISQFPTSISATDSRELRSRWTSVFRLLLALVQHEPSILCQCMNRNLDRIVQCNRILHTATEHALWYGKFIFTNFPLFLSNFMDCVINDCLRVTNLHAQMLKCCASWQGWLDLIQVKLGNMIQIIYYFQGTGTSAIERNCPSAITNTNLWPFLHFLGQYLWGN
jgi:hypothetical protein